MWDFDSPQKWWPPLIADMTHSTFTPVNYSFRRAHRLRGEQDERECKFGLPVERQGYPVGFEHGAVDLGEASYLAASSDNPRHFRRRAAGYLGLSGGGLGVRWQEAAQSRQGGPKDND